jgi:hypothetical protein
MTGLAWGNGRFVSTGPNGWVMSSPDGTNWINAKPPGQADYLDVAFGNGRFVMGGSQGKIAVSTTGTNWLVQDLTAPGAIRRVCFGNNVFVAYDHPYEFYLSQDGTNWSRRIPAMLVMPDDLAAGAGVWVGVDNRRRAIYSSDLVNWTDVPFRTSYSLLGIAYGNSTLVAVGGNGIWQTAPLVTLTSQPGAPGSFTLSGPPGGLCEIQRTDSLSAQTWANAGTVTLSNTPAPWVDVTAGTNRFYRARLVQ